MKLLGRERQPTKVMNPWVPLDVDSVTVCDWLLYRHCVLAYRGMAWRMKLGVPTTKMGGLWMTFYLHGPLELWEEVSMHLRSFHSGLNLDIDPELPAISHRITVYDALCDCCKLL